MRTARILGEGRSFYHVFSRTVNREMLCKAKDKSVFREIMRDVEAFTGVRVVTYVFLSNHFHLLLEVPDKNTQQPLTEEELISVLPRLCSADMAYEIEQELKRAREAGDERWHAEIMGRYEKQRGDLGQFMKKLKQRMTWYMNNEYHRTGTLWEGRYKSVLIEDLEQALMTMAAYIDLNPIRAGIESEPEAYHWSGYAEAMSESENAMLAREGLGLVLSEALGDPHYESDWEQTSARYRQLLYEEGQEQAPCAETGERGRRGFTAEEVEKVVSKGGKIPLASLLRHRVRYFKDGAVIGTAAFVEEVFQREKAKGGRFSQRRKTGARMMHGADWGELRVLRDLKKDVIGIPRLE